MIVERGNYRFSGKHAFVRSWTQAAIPSIFQTGILYWCIAEYEPNVWTLEVPTQIKGTASIEWNDCILPLNWEIM